MGRKGKPVNPDKPSPAVREHGRPKTQSELTLPVKIAPSSADGSKPPYRVPSMTEIAALPPNGFKVISTFSGCGGSCLGYRMAGFRVLWASEFIPAAQACYKANHPDSILDTRDIRKVRPEEILAAIGLKPGELDLFDGSPPCASFSTAGKRQAGWGKVKAYSDTKQRTDDLFFEYARILRGLQPKVFVAENVSGLVKGTAKGYFLEILKELKSCGYAVEARLLDAQWLGVPQMRQRIIFIGVRNDLGLMPCFPKPRSYRYSVRDAIAGVNRISTNSSYQERWVLPDRPATKVLAGGGSNKGGMIEIEAAPAVAESRDRRGGFGKEGEITDGPAPAILAGTAGNLWIEDANGYSGHEFYPDDRPMDTIQAQRPGRVVAPVEPEADIGKYAIGKEWDKLKPGESVYYGGRLWRPHLEKPSPTVTQIGGIASAASVAHPTERRKFSIAELKRICAFPDDFILSGTYAQQWERLGRAVPPVMMFHIACAVRDGVLRRLPGGAGT